MHRISVSLEKTAQCPAENRAQILKLEYCSLLRFDSDQIKIIILGWDFKVKLLGPTPPPPPAQWAVQNDSRNVVRLKSTGCNMGTL